jgi:hypothetical protein
MMNIYGRITDRGIEYFGKLVDCMWFAEVASMFLFVFELHIDKILE